MGILNLSKFVADKNAATTQTAETPAPQVATPTPAPQVAPQPKPVTPTPAQAVKPKAADKKQSAPKTAEVRATKSINKIQDGVVGKLYMAIEQIDKDAEFAKTLVKQAIDSAREFIVDNAPTVKAGSTVDIWKMVSTDDLLPAMQGVCHDHENKVAVVSDSHIIFVSPIKYNSEARIPDSVAAALHSDVLEKRKNSVVLDKYGNYIEGRYPRWQSVMPKEGDLTPIDMYSKEDLLEMLREAQADYKLFKQKDSPSFDNGAAVMFSGKMQEDKIGIRVCYVKRMLEFGLDGWMYNSSTRMVYKKNDKGEQMLICGSRLLDAIEESKLASNVYSTHFIKPKAA